MVDVYVALVVLALMAFDVVSGYLASVKEQNVSSSIMRTGLMKKCGSVLVLLLAFVVEHAGIYVGIDASVGDAVVMGVAALLGVMEITSVLENACKLNPDLPIASLFSMFGHVDTVDRDKDNG